MERKNAWKEYTVQDHEAVAAFAEEYKAFISENKTERECAATALERAREAGYISLEEARAAGTQAGAGAKVYAQALRENGHPGTPGAAPLRRGPEHLGRAYRQPSFGHQAESAV